MSKQDYTMYIYKVDRRCKAGERLFSTTVWQERDDEGMKREVRELQSQLYPATQFRIMWVPKMITVKNLLTGQNVQIPEDTPWCCNPASETYWSM
jgi:hypothetical protein